MFFLLFISFFSCLINVFMTLFRITLFSVIQFQSHLFFFLRYIIFFFLSCMHFIFFILILLYIIYFFLIFSYIFFNRSFSLNYFQKKFYYFFPLSPNLLFHFHCDLVVVLIILFLLIHTISSPILKFDSFDSCF